MSDDINQEREPSLRELTAIVKALDKLIGERLTALEKLMSERDRRYDERFEAQKDAVQAALVAAKELTAAAFAAAKEAISKSEVAQTAYNATHNDLTRKMDAQYKEMLPRQEADARFKGVEEKISELREFRSQYSGHEVQRVESRGTSQWAVTAGIAIAGIIVAVAIFAVGILVKFGGHS
jgi:hypothetical protein